MPRRKKRSLTMRAKKSKSAERRKQETPEERAVRLENMRIYARYCRANETPAKREQRLRAMRNYARKTRQRQTAKERSENFARVQERLKNEQELENFEGDPPQYFVKVEIVADDYDSH